MHPRPLAGLALVLAVASAPQSALAKAKAAAAQASPAPAASDDAPAKYETFVQNATLVPGLIEVIRKDGKLYLSLAKTQLGTDFIETSIPSTGLGGFGPAAGEPYVAPARILRFERFDDNVVLRWPNTIAKVDAASPQALSTQASLAASVIAVTPIVAESERAVVIAAAPFLGDVADLKAQFDAVVPRPEHAYHLDSARAFFTEAKSFPENTLLRVSQTWATDSPDTIDNVPDPRSVEVRMTYNIIAAPHNGYMPRVADPRVGYFTIPLLNFQSDAKPSRNVYYVSRWNFAPANPGKASPATHPLVLTLSNGIPVQYREAVRGALLAWNEAFARIGIQNAISVRQQPSDAGFDVDDIRNNMVSWVDTSAPQYGAEALIVNDPRTGEEMNVGVNIDAVAGLEGWRYRYYVAPARGLPDSAALEERFATNWIAATVLHEVGHDMGLQHNFIGSLAYSAKQLQDRQFTARYGIASSVMEYSPVNLWPKGTPQGDYQQLVLGPYDYYAIQYGYGYVPNATTPDAELPALNRLAARWSDPMCRFASDEDAFFDSGHAIDPRVQENDLTNDPLAWESMQLTLLHGLLDAVDKRFPQPGEPYDEARRAFTQPLELYLRYAAMPGHVIGGEYVSRANAGDPHGTPPLQAVPRAQEVRAWHMLERYLFSDAAWRFRPAVLARLTYSEVSSTSTFGTWAYNPPPRHDVPIVQVAERAQEGVLDELFAPLTLQRIDDLSFKYAAGTTMTLTDLFDWSRHGLYAEFADGAIARAGIVRRNAQMRFAKRLAQMWLAPAAGTPPDAQALARQQLVYLTADTAKALRTPHLDELTRAHVTALQALAHQALEARATLAVPAPPPASAAGPE